MHPEIARNQNYNDHYANDSEDVHCVLLPFHGDSVSVLAYLTYPLYIRWLCSTEFLVNTSRCYRHRRYPQ
jgi:hypothetical protein